MSLLELDQVTKRFGEVTIVEDLSLAVEAGDALGIVGPNGAGKTSLFGVISGDLFPDRGEVRFAGRPVTWVDAAVRCRLGVGRTYQVPRPFESMTVSLLATPSCSAAEPVTSLNTDPGGYWPAKARGNIGVFSLSLSNCCSSSSRDGSPMMFASKLGVLTMARISPLRGSMTIAAPPGALCSPSCRMRMTSRCRSRSIEHVVRALTSTVDRLICLAGGSIIGDGRPDEVLSSAAVREVFLGTEATAESLAESGATREGSGRS